MKAIYILPVLMLVLGLNACRKNEITGGGPGGSVNINVVAQHQARDIDNCWIYIKYNATEAPVLTGYDDSMLAASVNFSRPMTTFRQLTFGNYYLFATGYDPVYQQKAKGSIVVTIDRQRDYNINIPMSVYR